MERLQDASVLLVANGYPPGAMGGVETYTAQLAGALTRAGRHVRVFCRDDDPSMAEGSWRDDFVSGIEVRRVTNRFLRVSGFADYYVSDDIDALFRRTLAEWRPDVVHFQHAIGLSARLPAIAAEVGVPSAWTLWDYWPICPVNTLLLPDGSLCPGSHTAVNCFVCVYGSPRPFPGRHIPVEPNAAGDDDAIRHPFGLTEGTMHRLRLLLPRTARLRMLDLYNVFTAARSRLVEVTRRSGEGHFEPERLPPPAVAYRADLMRQALHDCSVVIAPLPFVRDTYLDFGLDADRVVLAEPGMDLSRWRREPRSAPAADRPLRLGYIGSLMRHKGLGVVLDALKRLPGEDLELRLHGFFVPGDEYAGQVRRRMRSDRRIRWMGPYEPHELEGILADIDVMLMPAQWHETFSFVTREAILGGVPVLASNMGGMRHAVRDGENGRLLPPGDATAWADAIAQLAHDRATLARMSEACAESPIRPIEDDAAELIRIYASLRPDGEAGET